MPRLNADRGKAGVDESTVEPFRQRAGLVADKLDVIPAARERLFQRRSDTSNAMNSRVCASPSVSNQSQLKGSERQGKIRFHRVVDSPSRGGEGVRSLRPNQSPRHSAAIIKPGW